MKNWFVSLSLYSNKFVSDSFFICVMFFMYIIIIYFYFISCIFSKVCVRIWVINLKDSMWISKEVILDDYLSVMLEDV